MGKVDQLLRAETRGSRRFLRPALLALLIFAASFGNAFAYTYRETYEADIVWTTRSYSLDLWHYSGGYWQGSDSSGRSIKIRDRQLDASGLKGSLESTQYIQWRTDLPQIIKEELQLGSKVRIRTEASSKLYRDTFCEIAGASEAVIYARPIFNIDPNYSLNSFVSGIKVTIPLVSSSYGCNLYSLYGHLKTNVVGTGRFSSSQPGKISPPYIHPSMIENSSGKLKRGFSILAGGSETASDGWSVGLFTLSRGGAVGLRFEFPIKIIYSVERTRILTADDPSDSTRQEDNTGTGTASSCGKSSGSSGGNSGGKSSGSSGGNSGGSGKPSGSGSSSVGKNDGANPGSSGKPPDNTKPPEPGNDPPLPPEFDIYGARIHRVY